MKIFNLSETNSILNNYIKEIRDVNIQKDRMRFRKNMQRIGSIMAYEISKTFSYEEEKVQTPLGTADCNIADSQIVVGTIIRAGIPFLDGFLSCLDMAESAFVSAYRKQKETHLKNEFDIHIEYIASPDLNGKTLIVADPMLATGSSMALSIRALMTKGTPARLIIASVISSQQGVDYCIDHFGDLDNVSLYTAAIDPLLNDHAYIIPGLGDAGDLSYGAKL